MRDDLQAQVRAADPEGPMSDLQQRLTAAIQGLRDRTPHDADCGDLACDCGAEDDAWFGAHWPQEDTKAARDAWWDALVAWCGEPGHSHSPTCRSRIRACCTWATRVDAQLAACVEAMLEAAIESSERSWEKQEYDALAAFVARAAQENT
jgi:hypothetical protein